MAQDSPEHADHDSSLVEHLANARKAAALGETAQAVRLLRRLERLSKLAQRQNDCLTYRHACSQLIWGELPATLTTPYVPMLPARLAEAIKREITEDIANGRVPASAATFTELHDYVDANCYGGTEALWDHLPVDAQGDVDEEARNLLFDLMNTAMALADRWLKNGRPDEPKQERPKGNSLT